MRQAALAAGRDHLREHRDGLARWFSAIFLVIFSKGGISAMELQRQMGFGSHGMAGAWRHKIRGAMVVPVRKPLGERGGADETLIGGPRSGRPGRGAAGKTVVAGAVEAGRGKGRGPSGRLRSDLRMPRPDSLEGFLASGTARRGQHGRLGRLCRARPGRL